MARAIRGYAGQQLKFASGGKSFRLGIVVEDENGIIYGLTVRHALNAGSGAQIIDAQTGELVAVRTQPPRYVQESKTYEVIEAFRLLDQDGSYESALRPDYRYHILDPATTVGARIKKDAYFGSEHVIGTVVTVGRSFEFMPTKTSSPILVYDLIETVFDNSINSIIVSGDAGALITDLHGGALGLILAIDQDYCYVAPLLPFLAGNKFFLVPRYLRKSMPLTSDAIAEKLSRNLEFVTEGLRHMRPDNFEE